MRRRHSLRHGHERATTSSSSAAAPPDCRPRWSSPGLVGACVVVDAGAPRNAPAAHMQGFLSRDGMPPAELLATGRAEVTAYGGEIVDSTVEQLSSRPAARTHRRSSPVWPTERRCAAVGSLVTTGLHDELPDIPGLRDRWARDVLHCPYCHGYEVRDQRARCPLERPGTPGYAQIVRQWSHDVVLFAPTDTLTDDPADRAASPVPSASSRAPVTGVDVTDDRLAGVTLVDGSDPAARRPVRAAPASRPTPSLLVSSSGASIDDDGWVTTGADREHQRRRRPGRRQRRQPARPGHHRRRRGICGRDRGQRRPRRGGRPPAPSAISTPPVRPIRTTPQCRQHAGWTTKENTMSETRARSTAAVGRDRHAARSARRASTRSR